MRIDVAAARALWRTGIATAQGKIARRRFGRPQHVAAARRRNSNVLRLDRGLTVTRGGGKSKNDLGHDKPGRPGDDRTRDDAWRDLSYTGLGDRRRRRSLSIVRGRRCSGEFWKGASGSAARTFRQRARQGTLLVYIECAVATPERARRPAAASSCGNLLFGFSLIAVLAAYAWLYAKNRSKIARVDEGPSPSPKRRRTSVRPAQRLRDNEV